MKTLKAKWKLTFNLKKVFLIFYYWFNYFVYGNKTSSSQFKTYFWLLHRKIKWKFFISEYEIVFKFEMKWKIQMKKIHNKIFIKNYTLGFACPMSTRFQFVPFNPYGFKFKSSEAHLIIWICIVKLLKLILTINDFILLLSNSNLIIFL